MTADDRARGESWRRLRPLLEELFELSGEARARRLAELPPELAREAEAFLAADADENASRLDGRLAGRVAAAIESVVAESASGNAPAPGPAPGDVVGAWRLERILGRGGMAEVWEARRADGQFEQTVAVKLLKRGMDSEEIVRRFVRERQILAHLDHPGIARLFDGGLAPDGRPYLVMERIDGVAITAWCAERRLALAPRLELLVAACRAVAAAHRSLVVHRDLKPSNILVTTAGEVKLLDFGIAKLLAEDPDGAAAHATRAEIRVLTPSYAAPEQILGEPVSTATDVYALGVLAYELTTGRLPHRRPGRSLDALASAVEGESIARPSTAVLELPADADAAPDLPPPERRRRSRALAGDLDTVILQALRREPARRYPSVEAFAADLERFLAGRTVAARPDSPGYRMRKFVGRHRVAVAATALGLGALVAALFVALAQRDRAQAQALRAERVQRFLVEVFEKADPGESLGAEVTARQIVDAGVASVDQELAGEPAVAADLYDALADIHHELGLVPRARELAERALALREGPLPHDAAKIAATLRRLVMIHLDGEMAGALPLAERAHRLAVEGSGANSIEAALAEGELAFALLYAERRDEALAHQRHAVEALRGAAGESDAATAEARIQLAEMLESAGGFEEAVGLYEAALPALTAERGERHPDVTIARRDFAGLLDRLGRTREAEPILARALAAQREVLGDRHWQVGETLFSYALLLASLGRYEEGERMLREAIAIPGPAELAAHERRYLGINLTEQGRHDEAVVELEAAIAAYRKLQGPDSREGWRAVANLGWAELGRGRSDLAEARLREAIAALERLGGPESYPVRQPLRLLGQTLRTRGRFDESIAILRRTRALEVTLFGTEDHPDIAVTDLELARTLVAAGGEARASEARRLLDESIALLERHRPESSALAAARRERAALS